MKLINIFAAIAATSLVPTLTAQSQEITPTSTEKAKTLKPIVLAVKGMTCKACSGKVTKELEKLTAVSQLLVNHETSTASLTLDTSKTNLETIVTTINNTGYKVIGQKLSITITGMTCEGCSMTLTKKLESIEGCKVISIDHKKGNAQLVIDHSKTSKQQIIKAINQTGFKA